MEQCIQPRVKLRALLKKILTILLTAASLMQAFTQMSLTEKLMRKVRSRVESQ